MKSISVLSVRLSLQFPERRLWQCQILCKKDCSTISIFFPRVLFRKKLSAHFAHLSFLSPGVVSFFFAPFFRGVSRNIWIPVRLREISAELLTRHFLLLHVKSWISPLSFSPTDNDSLRFFFMFVYESVHARVCVRWFGFLRGKFLLGWFSAGVGDRHCFNMGSIMSRKIKWKNRVRKPNHVTWILMETIEPLIYV